MGTMVKNEIVDTKQVLYQYLLSKEKVQIKFQSHIDTHIRLLTIKDERQ